VSYRIDHRQFVGVKVNQFVEKKMTGIIHSWERVAGTDQTTDTKC
jgi:hypothetical protein